MDGITGLILVIFAFILGAYMGYIEGYTDALNCVQAMIDSYGAQGMYLTSVR